MPKARVETTFKSSDDDAHRVSHDRSRGEKNKCFQKTAKVAAVNFASAHTGLSKQT